MVTRAWLAAAAGASAVLALAGPLNSSAGAVSPPTQAESARTTLPKIPSIYGVAAAQSRPGALDEYCAQYGRARHGLAYGPSRSITPASRTVCPSVN